MSEKNEIMSSRPFFDNAGIEKILSDIRKTLKNGVLTDGPYVKKFEEAFAKYIGTAEAVALNSGTCSLEIALRYFDIRGREVVVPTNTFIASGNTVLFAGGKPILADIKEKTLCIDPDDVQKRITSKTKGIMVVHIAGLVCPEIYELKEICHDHGLFLIEDAAHAHGAMIDGKKAGSLGDAGSFSFYPTKVMTSCEGGMITTDDHKLAKIARSVRAHGIDKETGQAVRLGYNWRMHELSAIVGLRQLEQLETFIKKREEIAMKYEKGLRRIKGVKPIFTPSNIRNSYYKYPVLVDDEVDPVQLAAFMKSKFHINTGNVYYPPCHLHPLYKEMFGYREGDLPVSERVLRRVITLPMHVQLTASEINRVLKGLDVCLQKACNS